MNPTPNPNRLPAWMLGTLLFVPWLNPYAAGPIPNVWPLLLSALCGIAVWFYRHRLSTRLIAMSWLVAATVSALIGMVQYFGYAPTLEPWISQTQQAGEAFANLRQRNQFATLTSIGLIALIGLLALQAKESRVQEWRVPAWAYLSALVLALGNAASSSRTGLLQWVLIGLFTAWWTLPARWHLVVFAVRALLAYGVAVFTLPLLLQWVTGVESGGLFGRLVVDIPACESRKILWSNVLTLIADKPWLGWGWRELDYAHFITLYQGPRFCDILDNAHNLPLHLAVELGLPVALGVCGAAAWLILRQRPWREQNPDRQLAWAVLALIGLHSLLEYPLWYGPFQMAVGLCLCVLWQTRQIDSFRPKYESNWPLAQVLKGLLAMFLIVVCAVVAWDYHRISQIYLAPIARAAAYRDDTLAKSQGSWFFSQQVLFAELNLTPLTRANAQWTFDAATRLLHFSPESRVIEKVIESATLLGRDDEALFYLARYRAAFPADHARWAQSISR